MPTHRDWVLWRAYKKITDEWCKTDFKREFTTELERCENFLSTPGSMDTLIEDLCMKIDNLKAQGLLKGNR